MFLPKELVLLLSHLGHLINIQLGCQLFMRGNSIWLACLLLQKVNINIETPVLSFNQFLVNKLDYFLTLPHIFVYPAVLVVHGMLWFPMMHVYAFVLMPGQRAAWKLPCFWKMSVLFYEKHSGEYIKLNSKSTCLTSNY